MSRWLPLEEDRHDHHHGPPGPHHHRPGHRPPHFMLAEGISHVSAQLERIELQLEAIRKQLEKA